jgi:hypothetical protein
VVHVIVHEFFEEHLNGRIREIQRTHLGQALVRFVQAHDRDLLILTGPHPYGDISFSLVRHNRARNWRAMQFNQECWRMLMGFPLDHWNHEVIHCAIGSFGRVVLWENYRRNLARLLVRVRVTYLVDVPHFILLTESEGFEGESWTIQCEVLQQELLGGGLADEEPVPVPNPNGQPSMFDFFDLGQSGQPPFNPGLGHAVEEPNGMANMGGS